MKSFLRIAFFLLLPLASWAAAAELKTEQTLGKSIAPQKRNLMPTTRIAISPGATVYRQTDGFQATVTVTERFSFPLYLGIETGYMKWNPSTRTDYKGMSVGQTTIPLLTTALYRFENDAGVYPYIGGSFGVALTRPDSGENLFQLAMYLRPGVEFEIGRNVSFTLEPKVGLLDGSFLFAPQVGLSLSL